MNESLLDKIAQGCNTFCLCNEWRNGKAGSISDIEGKCIFRFYELISNENGDQRYAGKRDDSAPVVAVGIIAFWLQHRKNNDVYSGLFLTKPNASMSIREQFDSYTKIRYDGFKAEHKDDPDAWNLDWDREFFGKYIIPHEMRLNVLSEALFEYVTESDVQLLQRLMENYINYLKMRREELGYYVCDELKVMRAIESKDEFQLEDLENIEIGTILDNLESEGYVKIARCEGDSSYDDVRLLDKGRAYLKQLEAKLNAGSTMEDKEDSNQGHYVPNIEWDNSLDIIFDERLDPRIVYLHLKDMYRPNLKDYHPRFFVYYTVLSYLEWVVGSQADFLRWANLHWSCGWNLKNTQHFKFTSIKKELRDEPLKNWHAGTVPGSNIGLEYRKLAEDAIGLLTETVGKEWLQDKPLFYCEGVKPENYINKGDRKHPFPSTV